jgi:hypothetical protein
VSRTRANKKSRDARRAAPPRKRPAPWQRGRVIVLALVAAAIVGVILVRRPWAPRPHGGAVPREVALARGLEATTRGVDQEAEMWFRRGLMSAPDDPLLVVDLCVALNNECFRIRPCRGVDRRALATSRDCFAAARECLGIYAAAEERIPTIRGFDRDRGQLFDTWGLPLEALNEYRVVQTRGDTTMALRRAVGRILKLQTDPRDGADQYVEDQGEAVADGKP